MWRSRIGAIGAGVCLASSVLFSLGGCNSQPSRIEPGLLPGITTPAIDFYPPPGGVPNLPPGFYPCQSFTTPVTFEDGSVVTLSGCMYCSGTPGDPTVYIQHNCTGNYWKGMKNRPLGQQQAELGGGPQMPDGVSISDVDGQLGATSSLVTFVVDDAIDFPDMFAEFDGTILIDGLTLAECEENGYAGIDAGMTVLIQGTNEQIADLLFWGFGSIELEALTDSEDEIVLKVGFSQDLGAVIVPFVNGTVDTSQVGFFPWRAE